MHVLVSALRTGVAVAAIAATVTGGALASAATPDTTGGVPLEVATPAAQPTQAESIWATTTGSAALDLLTLLGAPTGSMQKPCNLPNPILCQIS
ncbi:hypothetical protein ACFVUS_27325 [Nocardia sp. NPDC058058]|uniref:hypothetical protein n=1 Tax=Nocardia sp. NPDC058058 TaxID=3346317 RepID=UPI0036DBC5A9